MSDRVPRPVASAARDLGARLAALLRWEDVLLSVVALIGLPLLERLATAGSAPGSDSGSAGPTALTGAAGLVSILGVLVCLCTRGPGETPTLDDRGMTFQGWARFPLMAGTAIIAVETLPGLGIEPEPFVALTFLVVIVTAFIGGVLPVAPVALRRTLVTPMALLATGVFNRILGTGFGGAIWGAIEGTAQPEIRAFLPLIIAAIATLYVMLVAAPRAIADPGASGLAWTVRFLVLLASLVVGDVLLGVPG